MDKQTDKITRKTISRKIENLLWGRAGGRCEICNCLLSTDEYTEADGNYAQVAHIIAASENGPRSNSDLTRDDRAKIDNLMLVCYNHHTLMDKEQERQYTPEELRKFKHEHEERIRMVTEIAPNKKSLVVCYGPRVGGTSIAINKSEVCGLLFPERYPATNEPIEIEVQNINLQDNEELYWKIEERQLAEKIEKDVLPNLKGDITHISLFALAPQPLLVKLGTLLTDINNVKVYQKHREPDTWRWLDTSDKNKIYSKKNNVSAGVPVIVFAISAQAILERATKQYQDRPMWVVTCTNPHNDMMRTESDLSEFRTIVRLLLDEVNSYCHKENYNEIDILMAMPCACAVELGRCRMNKADFTWNLYDYRDNKDVKRLTIK